ncbi:MAG: cytochrome c3 family protein [Calditrichia bacterium]
MGKPGIKILIILSCITLAGAIIGASGDQGSQPIQYNHKLHVEEADLTCLDCHQNANTLSRASIPNISICGDCHDDVESENIEERKVAEYVVNGANIPWVQVHYVPDHAYFSHRRHVKLAQIECTTCHGDVSQMEKPFIDAFVVMEMEWCMDCHETRNVTKDCYACHR